jgi:hypothetical protein
MIKKFETIGPSQREEGPRCSKEQFPPVRKRSVVRSVVPVVGEAAKGQPRDRLLVRMSHLLQRRLEDRSALLRGEKEGHDPRRSS